HSRPGGHILLGNGLGFFPGVPAMTAVRLRRLVPRLRELVSPGEVRATDPDLLGRFTAKRDDAAFAEVVRRPGPTLLRLGPAVLHRAPEAEDVCQAAFLLLAQRAASTAWGDSVAGWLFQTAYRLSLKARVAAARRARKEARARPAPQPDPVAELTVRELQSVL